jgi:hypothetical protein
VQQRGREQQRFQGNLHHQHTYSKTKSGQGRVAHHRARHKSSRRREGGAPVASIARASGVADAEGRGIGIGPARCACIGGTCITRGEVLAGRAVGADRAAGYRYLPGRAEHAGAATSAASSRGRAGRTCLEGVGYTCAAGGSKHSSSVKATGTIGTISARRKAGRGVADYRACRGGGHTVRSGSTVAAEGRARRGAGKRPGRAVLAGICC